MGLRHGERPKSALDLTVRPAAGRAKNARPAPVRPADQRDRQAHGLNFPESNARDLANSSDPVDL